MLKQKSFIIVSKLDNNDFQCWNVDLPENIFDKYINEGGSTVGDKQRILESVAKSMDYIKE